MIRSFLAIELPTLIAERLQKLQEDLKASDADVRWVDPKNIHLTLKFFGSIEESQIDSILQSIEISVQSKQPFWVSVRGMGAFPHPKNPRVIWVGLVEGKEVLVQFQKQLEASLEKVGFQTEDRSFHPHLTLGRVRSSRGKGSLAAKIEKYREEDIGTFQVERVTLFQSDLKPSGPVYIPLRELHLCR